MALGLVRERGGLSRYLGKNRRWVWTATGNDFNDDGRVVLGGGKVLRAEDLEDPEFDLSDWIDPPADNAD